MKIGGGGGGVAVGNSGWGRAPGVFSVEGMPVGVTVIPVGDGDAVETAAGSLPIDEVQPVRNASHKPKKMIVLFIVTSLPTLISKEVILHVPPKRLIPKFLLDYK